MVAFVIKGQADARTFDLYDFVKGNPVYSDQTPTSWKVSYSGTNATIVQGTGFIYDPDTGAPTSGTTNAATRYINQEELGTISGLSITQDQAIQYIIWNDSERVNQDVFKGNDTITSSGFNDYLNGWGGADVLSGGVGNDTYVVDRKTDVVIDKARGGLDTVKAGASYALAAKQEIEVLKTVSDTAKTAIKLTGNAYVNTITGNAGTNVLDGGLGSDILKGGFGKDTFFFSTKPSGSNLDHIKDFKAVDDTIKLENTGSGLFTKLAKGGLDADEFAFIKSSKEIVDGDVHILYDKARGALYYDPNGGTAAGRVEFAVLDNHAALTYKDFLIV